MENNQFISATRIKVAYDLENIREMQKQDLHYFDYPDIVYGFSAICWMFGKQLNQTLKVPVGLVESAWGGTRIEAWMSPEALESCTYKDNGYVHSL